MEKYLREWRQDAVNKQTALHYAVLKGWKQTAIILIKNGADPLRTDSTREIPIFYAVDRNDLEMVYLLGKYMGEQMQHRDPDEPEIWRGYAYTSPVDGASLLDRALRRCTYKIALMLLEQAPKLVAWHIQHGKPDFLGEAAASLQQLRLQATKSSAEEARKDKILEDGKLFFDRVYGTGTTK